MSAKRPRVNNNARKFMTSEDVTYQLTYNYKRYDKISDKVKERLEKVPKLIINPVSKEYYKAPIQYIIYASSVEQDFCNELEEDYIHFYFNKSDALLELLDEDNTLVGYSLINFNHDEKDIKANLICASKKNKNVGTLIIDMLNDVGASLKYKRIILGATTQALPFYLKKEFYCEKEECPMYRLIKKSSGGGKTRKRRST